ncbi:rust resistance kinase Lr10-like isoform X1 [Prunus yedoensis var. nudiflora]|uniref:Rust resistance kinase Lr10-like isoform X1 n=1 Tax=Prunus yedoensis var. nudiflora TaxID=2094558 RepID=A0A314UWS5_PRUYE|nr:rust resistance kinase Lr10-like isoform X1 [Prunus yedoensis var. nudiflora]
MERDSRYTLHCDNNVTVLHLHSGKYLMLALNYDYTYIRVVDPGLEKNSCSSIPRYPLAHSNFSLGDLYYPSSQSVTFFKCANPVKSSLNVVTAPCINNLRRTNRLCQGSRYNDVGSGGLVQYRVDDYE